MAPNAEPDRDFPWWLVILAITGLWLLYKMLADPFYAGALAVLSKGLVVTLAVASFASVQLILSGFEPYGEVRAGKAMADSEKANRRDRRTGARPLATASRWIGAR